MLNNYKGLIRMNLQLLAEDDGAVGGESVNSTEESKNAEESKTYTQEELNKLLQSEGDKRVTSALKKAKAEWEKEQEEKISEAERLAKMTADERAKAEAEKKTQALIEENERYKKANLELQAKNNLKDQGLDESFSSFLLGVDAESTNDNIKNFKGAFDKAVEAEVNERLKGKSPSASTGISTITKDDIMKIEDKQARLKAITENQHLFE
ncbi:DUF4355 domain-containing protein [Peptostreptococcus equinus]|uniref:DUF4355 domain-containing protein n=1 Tax=Peptostreptococcus equinus TaxID=3003601 RepID=A0ABY7JPJ2_9FIRM|nr:DUF4355 domain-containing protein [Peptostreptococcus sp. CBA3647]WAW15282.1 DUF4355 domain-containing protein [Peptostreptococcus sp. CBA3647]